jgi:CDP-glucose 4,6-dehydratase
VEEVGMTREFWAGRRVLVTGHTGFKGSWLTLLLSELGSRVTGYALDPPTTPNLFEAARVAQGVESVRGDIADVPALEALVRRANPDVVVHMAAQSLVRASYDDPMETYRVNLMGTVAVLEALRRVPGRRTVIVVTTDKCYENREWAWGYREIDALGGRDPYSNSKACAELASAAYRSSFFPPAEHAKHGVAMATARAGNVIGGGDWGRDRVVPDIVEALRAGRPAKIRNPDAYRPWQHVLDALHGYVSLAERLTAAPAEFAEAWNFGPSEENVLPVRALADDVCRLWGSGARWEQDAGPKPHEATRLMLDSSKARARLGLPRNLDYRTAIAWTAEWYKAFHDGGDARELTLAQIRKHLSEGTR